ncbi:MAG: hypothetical protein P1V20_25635 [Verrucomicrobiales bacterium]|nr:hypothetical protein [Verrucomicrobiales bacterium]
MKFPCPTCHNNIDVPPEWSGNTINCPHVGCGSSITVPQFGNPPVTDSPPATGFSPHSHTPVQQPVAPSATYAPSAPVTTPQVQGQLRHTSFGEPSRNYGGLTRVTYWLGTIALGIVLGIFGAVVGAAMGNSSRGGASSIGIAFFIISAIGGFVQICLAWSRLKNIGMKPEWSLLMLIPLVGLIVHVRCLLFQEGYEDAKKLDTTGKTLVWVILGLFLVPFVFGLIAVAISSLAG